MRKLQDQTGVEAPSADYPKGRIKNNQTLINEEVNGDIIQFFQKLVDLAGITENTNPDNETNGYQLIEALDWYRRNVAESWIDVVDTQLSNGWATWQYFQYRRNKQGLVELRFSVDGTTATADTIFVLPVGFRPTVDIGGKWSLDSANANELSGDLLILSDGTIRLQRGRSETGGVLSYWRPSVSKIHVNLTFATD